jgi:threonine dehydrogenase-like Zn-dependent dehydrogenase
MMYAPMVELYGIAHHVLRRGQVQLGETVVILGSGKVGLSIIDVLSHGSKTNLIVCTDQHESRLATAKKLGADQAVNIMQQDPVALVKEVTGGTGADCVIEAVGHYCLAPGQAAPLEQAVQMIRNGGRIVTLGLGDHPSTVNFKTLVLKEATLIASRVTLGEFPQAARLMEKQLLHPEILVTHRMEMGEVKEAFAEADRERGETLKIVLDIQAG